jgi:hypothetical protein
MTEQLSIAKLEQRQTALLKANKVRTDRSADKRAIFRGELDPAKILLEVPEYWRSATVADLLLSIRRVGRVKANRWCVMQQMSLTTRLDALSERRRALLARQVSVWSQRRTDMQRADA